jgi:hypothetical protein
MAGFLVTLVRGAELELHGPFRVLGDFRSHSTLAQQHQAKSQFKAESV